MPSKLPIPNTNLAQVHQLQGLFRLTSCGHGLCFTLAPCAASAASRASLELDFQSLQGFRSPGQSGWAGRGGWVRGRARQAEPCSEESNLAPDIWVEHPECHDLDPYPHGRVLEVMILGSGF